MDKTITVEQMQSAGAAFGKNVLGGAVSIIATVNLSRHLAFDT
jgi:hypothetical protein